MITKFVCLANSFNEGGRCIAGIELDNNNSPKFENGHPKWIRPISNAIHGEVPTFICSNIKILDIVKLDLTIFSNPHNYQSENALFQENSIEIEGIYSPNNLFQLCNTRKLIFGNTGKAISEDAIRNLTYSLMLIKTNQFEIVVRRYEDNPDKNQIRLVFSYNGNQYNFPVSDPVFLYKYQINPNFFASRNEIYLTISITIPWNKWYYKLVAGVILIDNH
ncbi:MAG: hypothetical protein NT004_16320 [Bacteroidetes bacterium]|nr:hypothetical protein [Bacteroidota bacterium]